MREGEAAHASPPLKIIYLNAPSLKNLPKIQTTQLNFCVLIKKAMATHEF